MHTHLHGRFAVKDAGGLVIAVVLGITLRSFGNALVGVVLMVGLAIYIKLHLLGRDFRKAALEQRDLANRVLAKTDD